jgi:hypothetical protein
MKRARTAQRADGDCEVGTTTAAGSGTPQVVMPHGYDQHNWAERVPRRRRYETTRSASQTTASAAHAAEHA